MEGSCSKAEWSVHIGQVFCFWTETRSSLGNWLICYGLVPTLTLPTPFKYHTIHLCALIREKCIWLRKSSTKHALFSSPTMSFKAGCFDTRVTINTWTPEKHGLTSSDHKTKGMVGRLFLRMNKLIVWRSSTDVDLQNLILVWKSGYSVTLEAVTS